MPAKQEGAQKKESKDSPPAKRAKLDHLRSIPEDNMPVSTISDKDAPGGAAGASSSEAPKPKTKKPKFDLASLPDRGPNIVV